jgi:hypothetical protein
MDQLDKWCDTNLHALPSLFITASGSTTLTAQKTALSRKPQIHTFTEAKKKLTHPYRPTLKHIMLRQDTAKQFFVDKRFWQKVVCLWANNLVMQKSQSDKLCGLWKTAVSWAYGSLLFYSFIIHIFLQYFRWRVCISHSNLLHYDTILWYSTCMSIFFRIFFCQLWRQRQCNCLKCW